MRYLCYNKIKKYEMEATNLDIDMLRHYAYGDTIDISISAISLRKKGIRKVDLYYKDILLQSGDDLQGVEYLLRYDTANRLLPIGDNLPLILECSKEDGSTETIEKVISLKPKVLTLNHKKFKKIKLKYSDENPFRYISDNSNVLDGVYADNEDIRLVVEGYVDFETADFIYRNVFLIGEDSSWYTIDSQDIDIPLECCKGGVSFPVSAFQFIREQDVNKFTIDLERYLVNQKNKDFGDDIEIKSVELAKGDTAKIDIDGLKIEIQSEDIQLPNSLRVRFTSPNYDLSQVSVHLAVDDKPTPNIDSIKSLGVFGGIYGDDTLATAGMEFSISIGDEEVKYILKADITGLGAGLNERVRYELNPVDDTKYNPVTLTGDYEVYPKRLEKIENNYLRPMKTSEVGKCLFNYPFTYDGSADLGEDILFFGWCSSEEDEIVELGKSYTYKLIGSNYEYRGEATPFEFTSSFYSQDGNTTYLADGSKIVGKFDPETLQVEAGTKLIKADGTTLTFIQNGPLLQDSGEFNPHYYIEDAEGNISLPTYRIHKTGTTLKLPIEALEKYVSEGTMSFVDEKVVVHLETEESAFEFDKVKIENVKAEWKMYLPTEFTPKFVYLSLPRDSRIVYDSATFELARWMKVCYSLEDRELVFTEDDLKGVITSLPTEKGVTHYSNHIEVSSSNISLKGKVISLEQPLEYTCEYDESEDDWTFVLTDKACISYNDTTMTLLPNSKINLNEISLAANSKIGKSVLVTDGVYDLNESKLIQGEVVTELENGIIEYPNGIQVTTDGNVKLPNGMSVQPTEQIRVDEKGNTTFEISKGSFILTAGLLEITETAIIKVNLDKEVSIRVDNGTLNRIDGSIVEFIGECEIKHTGEIIGSFITAYSKGFKKYSPYDVIKMGNKLVLPSGQEIVTVELPTITDSNDLEIPIHDIAFQLEIGNLELEQGSVVINDKADTIYKIKSGTLQDTDGSLTSFFKNGEITSNNELKGNYVTDNGSNLVYEPHGLVWENNIVTLRNGTITSLKDSPIPKPTVDLETGEVILNVGKDTVIGLTDNSSHILNDGGEVRISELGEITAYVREGGLVDSVYTFVNGGKISLNGLGGDRIRRRSNGSVEYYPSGMVWSNRVLNTLNGLEIPTETPPSVDKQGNLQVGLGAGVYSLENGTLNLNHSSNLAISRDGEFTYILPEGTTYTISEDEYYEVVYSGTLHKGEIQGDNIHFKNGELRYSTNGLRVKNGVAYLPNGEAIGITEKPYYSQLGNLTLSVGKGLVINDTMFEFGGTLELSKDGTEIINITENTPIQQPTEIREVETNDLINESNTETIEEIEEVEAEVIEAETNDLVEDANIEVTAESEIEEVEANDLMEVVQDEVEPDSIEEELNLEFDSVEEVEDTIDLSEEIEDDTEIIEEVEEIEEVEVVEEVEEILAKAVTEAEELIEDALDEIEDTEFESIEDEVEEIIEEADIEIEDEAEITESGELSLGDIPSYVEIQSNGLGKPIFTTNEEGVKVLEVSAGASIILKKLPYHFANGGEIHFNGEKFEVLEYEQEISYKDCKNSDYEESIVSLSELGIVKGNDKGRFEPKSAQTRGEIAVVFHKTLSYIGIPMSASEVKFKDLPEDKNYTIPMKVLHSLGVLTDSNNKLKPKDKVTNDDFLVILANTLDVLGLEGDLPQIKLKDRKHIKNVGELDRLESVGLLADYDGKKFYPKERITKAEMCDLVFKLIELYYSV